MNKEIWNREEYKFPLETTTYWEINAARERFKRGDTVRFPHPEGGWQIGLFCSYKPSRYKGIMGVTVKCGEGFFWDVPFLSIEKASI